MLGEIGDDLPNDLFDDIAAQGQESLDGLRVQEAAPPAACRRLSMPGVGAPAGAKGIGTAIGILLAMSSTEVKAAGRRWP